MVMKLSEPPYNDNELIDKIVEDRQTGINAAFFNDYKDVWKAECQQYLEVAGDPHSLPPNPSLALKKANTMIDLYEKHPGTINDYIPKMRTKHGLRCCPFCGKLDVPTLDHYLPKASFPQFSLLTRNLVPMCSTCNTSKGNKIPVTPPGRFIHPYFDAFAETRLLQLIIKPPYDYPQFSIVPFDGLMEPTITICSYHIHELDINGHCYNHFAALWNYLSKEYIPSGDADVRNELITFLANQVTISKAMSKTYNNWDTLFFDSVVNDANCLEFLVKLTSAR